LKWLSPSLAEAEREAQGIVGQSQRMQSVFRLIKLIAKSQATILIKGESGSGKELVARAIHRLSPKHDRPFVTIDCGALSESLLESELFGHVKGAFTGAITNKKGLFEEAHGSTLLLDEIGDTTLAFQSKLLRLLQEGEIRPVGSTKSIRVDVRVIAATNRSLKQGVEDKTFRDDLYYRLAVVPIEIPPLRQREEDIPLLVNYFIRKYCIQNRIESKRVAAKALKRLLDHSWPGNVRELQHTIERAVLLSPGPEITLKDLCLLPAAKAMNEPLLHVTRTTIEAMEKEKIAKAIHDAQGNRAQAAQQLQISRATLYNRLKRYHFT